MPCVVVAVAAIETVAGAVKLAPAAGELKATVGAAGAVTVIETGAEVVVCPFDPIAFAVIVYEPAATFVQSKL